MPGIPIRSLAAVAAVSIPAFVLGLYVDSFWLRVASKPWPALALAAWTLRVADGTYARRVAAALVLCAVADVLLEFRQTHFVHGMAVFLAAQLTLASAFTLQRRRGSLPAEAAVALPFVLWMTLAFARISTGLGAMLAPVLAYMTAIGLMMWRAGAWFVQARGAVPAEVAAARMALAGAVVFGVSDTTIALDRFAEPIAGARYFIIATYWIALALIAASAVRLSPREG